MHVHFLDPYEDRHSLAHALDARVKLLLAVGFILVVALTHEGVWPVFVLLYALVLSAELLSELGVGYVLGRSLLALPFMLAAIPLLVTVAGQPLWNLALGPWTLTVSVEGLERFISVTLKSWLSVQMAVVLAGTTPFPDLLLAMRALRVPRLLVAVIGLMWRYLFVLVDEAIRLMRAREARSGHIAGDHGRAGGSLAWRARVTGGMAGNLFMRAFDRGDRIYAAMASRGYDGEVRSFPLPPLDPRQRLFLLLGLFLLALLAVLGHLL